MKKLFEEFYKKKYSHLLNTRFIKRKDNTEIIIKCIKCNKEHIYLYGKNFEEKLNYQYTRIDNLTCEIFHKNELNNVKNQMEIDKIDKENYMIWLKNNKNFS